MPSYFFVFFCGSCLASDNGFNAAYEYDAVCTRVTEILNSEDYASAPKKAQSQMLTSGIFDGIRNDDVGELFGVINMVNPEERYHVLKISIEEQIGSEWNCPALQKVMAP